MYGQWREGGEGSRGRQLLGDGIVLWRWQWQLAVEVVSDKGERHRAGSIVLALMMGDGDDEDRLGTPASFLDLCLLYCKWF